MGPRSQSIRFVATISAALLLISIRGPIVGTLQAAPDQEAAPQDATANPPDAAKQDVSITAEKIRDTLLESAAKLVDLKITVVERGDFSERRPDRPLRAVLKEMWLHKTSMQVRLQFRDDASGDEWWTGFESRQGPITSADLVTTPGVKECIDMSREMTSADSRPMNRPGPSGEIRTLHSLHKNPWLISNLFVPLVELEKPWILSNRQSGSPEVNRIARTPLAAWHLLGEGKLGDEDVIRAEIHRQDPIKIRLKRHDGELTLTPIYLLWLAKNRGFMPVRIENTMRYGYQGREYTLEAGPNEEVPALCEASDFVQVRGVWLPRAGREGTYQKKEEDRKKFDPSEIVDRILADGAVRMTGEFQVGRQIEWRILDIEPIDPSLNLWFEPQDGAEVVDMETHHRFIQGDAVASERFAARERAVAACVGKPAPQFPKGATWLNGEPLSWQALRGKVVILDFWAIDCGPCRADLPELRQLYDDRQKNGLTVIGVHIAGNELAEVKKSVDELKLKYPICIDTPIERGAKAEVKTFPSEMASQFGIDGIPHFVVVDQQGVVAASLGYVRSFEDVLPIAQKLVKAKD